MATNKDSVWDQGQIEILRELPSQEEVDNWLLLKAMLGPLSDSTPPLGYKTMSNEELERSGWIEYPIRSCNASTIHKICGDTLRKDPLGRDHVVNVLLGTMNKTRQFYLFQKMIKEKVGIRHETDE
eukprot:4257839-Ditylum_brightwellii.AAC.1